jgi:hypothetical protein
MKIYTKIRWVASILLVFFIVLMTNLIDRDNFDRLSQSVTTMYEEKIVGSDILFEMSTIIREQQIAVLTGDTTLLESKHKQHDQELNLLIERYKQTKLTKNEKYLFNDLQEDLQSLNFLKSSSDALPKQELLEEIDRINQCLFSLSKIQVEEGKRQFAESKSVKDTIDFYTQTEIIFLIVMAVLIQIVILYRPKSERGE